jgi:alpha-amylase/alpha-mannosidase (GH57 family)
MAKQNELEIGQKWTLTNPRNFGCKEDDVVEIVNFYDGNKNNINVRTPNLGKIYNGLYASDLKEQVLQSKDYFVKLLEEKEKEFQKTTQELNEKIVYIEESGNEFFYETEFKVYKTLKTLSNKDLSETERAKIIASLINN